MKLLKNLLKNNSMMDDQGIYQLVDKRLKPEWILKDVA